MRSCGKFSREVTVHRSRGLQRTACHKEKWILQRLFVSIHNMKTIAITIEISTLKHIDRLVACGEARCKNRSQLIRQAVQEYVARLERATEEEWEGEILSKHRARLKLQAIALVKEQAKL